MKKIRLTENDVENIVRKILKEDKLNEIASRSYIFDWDDNILFMPTKIKMDKKVGDDWEPIDVSTEEFAKVRTDPDYRIRNNNPEVAFEDFVLTDPFLRDTVKAIKSGSFAPSFEKFKEALIYGNTFAINTARGHKPRTLRRGVKMFINMVLTSSEKNEMIGNVREALSKLPNSRMFKLNTLDDRQILDLYLDEMGEYYPVSSKEFGERFGLETSGGSSNPEHAKKVAIEHFTDKVLHNVQKLVDSGHYTKVSVGFSDDDIRNVEASKEFLDDELRHLYPNIHFVVYDTSEGGKNKLVVKRED